ncbi:MAG: pyridoxal-phosphate dependent enzyme [Fibrobacter sp.]|nr:pyridoxal-phosphate dependent enzyme [Fibrobacter sp.]
MIPLFKAYPALNSIPYCSLGVFPTPVTRAEKLSLSLNRDGLFIKRDDLSGTLYGGNKLRKLEFILADASQKGSKRLITSGAAGSNHALATALYGKEAGFKVVLMLMEQPFNPKIADNLLADFGSGAEMFLDNTYEEHLNSMQRVIELYKNIDDCDPYIIPPGGSSIYGAVGYVNAAFELRDQIDNGLLPEPSVIYLPLGTMGTVAGLLLGLKAAGLKTRLNAVSVVPSFIANREKFTRLFNDTNEFLRINDPAFPVCSFSDDDLIINNRHFGEGYGIITREAILSIDILSRTEGITLDGVYTGKAFSAFLADIEKTGSSDEVLLYWNTKSSVPLPQESLNLDFRQLPEQFHYYFTTKTQ